MTLESRGIRVLTYDLVNSQGTGIGQISISPYILVLGTQTKLPDADKLKDSGFVGVGIQVGRCYTGQHTVDRHYLNPNFKEQFLWAKQHKLPIALLAHIDARNLNEAQIEFAKLYEVLRTYQPNIGVWFRVLSKGSSAQIGEIIEWYQKMMINRGFRYQIGFYNTHEELCKFDWQKFCDNRAGKDTLYKDFDRTSVSNYFINDWNLWWIDAPDKDSLSQTNALLRPEFFKLPR